ncbi:MAG TPA: superoxide dismutase family protein [Candidatus Eisenbacteria bacterium]|nr:superoxide dismutase family protein [Candidatus Eisenbacteria bacterium]
MKENALLIALFVLGLYSRDAALAQETARVRIINTERQEIGQATLTDTPAGVVITLTLREKPKGLSPGPRALHIHAVGKCEPPFKSAGDHYNPEKKHHGFLAKDGPHAGDLPNIHIPESGQLTVEFFAPDLRLKEGKNRLMDEDGSAIVIHAQKDDYRTDPAGNAGDRIACGVIESAKSK